MGLDVSALTRYAYLVGLLEQRLHPPAALLELGAAPGDQIAALADRGYRTTAVDIGIASDGWADGTEGRMARLLDEHGVRYVEWDLEKVPYPLADQAYDGVVFTEVFEHLRDYPVRALEEAHRVLRPGGYLFFTTPNAAYLRNRVNLLLGRSVYTPMPDWLAGVPHARHAREWLFSEIDEAMRIAGFEVEVRQGRHFHLDGGNGAKRVAKRGVNALATVRPTLGPQIVIVARRP